MGTRDGGAVTNQPTNQQKGRSFDRSLLRRTRVVEAIGCTTDPFFVRNFSDKSLTNGPLGLL